MLKNKCLLLQFVSKNVFRGSTYGVLKNDSSNIVDLVEDAYSAVSGKIFYKYKIIRLANLLCF